MSRFGEKKLNANNKAPRFARRLKNTTELNWERTRTRTEKSLMEQAHRFHKSNDLFLHLTHCEAIFTSTGMLPGCCEFLSIKEFFTTMNPTLIELQIDSESKTWNIISIGNQKQTAKNV